MHLRLVIDDSAIHSLIGDSAILFADFAIR
jgi:hypothetical protein